MPPTPSPAKPTKVVAEEEDGDSDCSLDMAPDEGVAPSGPSTSTATGLIKPSANERRIRRTPVTEHGVMMHIDTITKLGFGPEENPLRLKREQKVRHWADDTTFGEAADAGKGEY